MKPLRKNKTVVNHVLVLLLWLIVSISTLGFFIIANSKVIERYSVLINEAGKIRGGTQRIVKLNAHGIDISPHIADINLAIQEVNKLALTKNPLQASFNEQYFTAVHVQWIQLLAQFASNRSQQEVFDQSEIMWYTTNALVAHIEAQSIKSINRFYIVTIVFFAIAFILLVIFALTKFIIKDKIEYGATHDLLTGLYNRNYFQDAIEREYASYRRTKQEFSLLMCDIDHFKKINDTHGHVAGDRVLRDLGLLLRSQTRSLDTPVRYGGEEFVIIMPGANREVCTLYAERIRKAVANKRMRGRVRITISIGFCVHTPGMNAEQLIKNADEAMYRAKQKGRNRVVDYDSMNT